MDDPKELFIKDLKSFIDVCQNDLSNVLQTLNWTPEHILQREDRGHCPHNSNHVVPVSSLDKHTAICPLLQRGYSKEQATQLLQSNRYFYEGLESSVPTVDIDQEAINKILWDHHVKDRSIFYGQNGECLTRDDQEVQLTAPERAAIYGYAVTQAKALCPYSPLDDEFLTMNLEEFVKKKISGTDEAMGQKHENYLEYIKSERDYKRRRQTYRAKNVYTTKKSYTEVIRDVIENQTDLFASFIRMEGQQENREQEKAQENREQEGEHRGEGSSAGERSGHMSRERSRDGSRERKLHKSSERTSDRSRDFDQSREKQFNRSRDFDQSRERRLDRSRDRSRDKASRRERIVDLKRERSHEGSRDARERSPRDDGDSGKKRSESLSDDNDERSSKKRKKSSKKHKHKHKHKSK